jgi:hypothetical protein
MTVYAVFQEYYIEDHYRTERFVDVFSTHEKAQAFITSTLHEQKLKSKHHQLLNKFNALLDETNPFPSSHIRETKPKYDHTLTKDREYNRQYVQSLRDWESNNSLIVIQWDNSRAAAIAEYMATIDMNTQDLSDVDIEDNFSIVELEVK